MKKLIMAILATVVMGVGLVAAPVSAQDDPARTEGTGSVTCPEGSANQTAETIAGCNLKASTTDLWTTINTIINVALGVIGIVTVAMIIYGGFQYTTSAGDAGKAKKAKDTIMYGIIGLIIALLAFAIVNFVLSGVFGTNATTNTGN